MSITEHKRLVAAIPEDLKEGEEIEVSNSGEFWEKQKFSHIGFNGSDGFWIEAEHGTWNYARRPAAAQKKSLEQALAENGWGQRPCREDMERRPTE